MTIAHGGDIFAIARQRGWDWSDVLDMSASINPLGPAPSVRGAIIDAIDRIAHYPEREPLELREQLAELWGVHPDELLLGNGATELLHFYARVAEQGEVTLVVPTFSEFHRAWPAARLIAANQAEQLPSTGLVILTRPNNPLGAMTPVPWTSESLLVDESFIEFTGCESLAPRVRDDKRLLVLRSLTKFYALPGLRIGALVAHRDTVNELRRYREPWQVNVIAEAAARAAIADRAHAAASREYVCHERERLVERLCEIPGVSAEHSVANFLLLRCGTAQSLCAWFLERRVLVRDCSGTPGLEGECVRVAVRTREENERFLTLLEEYACSAS